MENGYYVYKIETPLPIGKRQGMLGFHVRSGKIQGTIRLLGHGNAVTGTLTPDGTLTLRGSFSTLLCDTPFEADGKADTKQIDFELHLPKSSFHMTGERTDEKVPEEKRQISKRNSK